MSKRILMVLTNHASVEGTSISTGYYLPEAAHPYARFKKAGFMVDFGSPKGGMTTITPDSIDLNDEENKAFHDNADIRSLTENSKPLSDFNGADYDVVFFVGGFGVM